MAMAAFRVLAIQTPKALNSMMSCECAQSLGCELDMLLLQTSRVSDLSSITLKEGANSLSPKYTQEKSAV